jgi:DNA modification methylase
MKFRRALYKQILLPESKYSDLFRDWTMYGNLVTFEPNITLPIYDWFYLKQGFSRNLVLKLLNEFEVKPPATILDPFCGVGTTLMASYERGMNALGVDILPLFVFITNVKLEALKADYDMNNLKNSIKCILEAKFEEPILKFPDIRFLHGIFDPKVLKMLLFFKEKIAEIESKKVRNLLMLSLLSIVKDVINAKRDGVILRRIKRMNIPDVKELLREKLIKMYNDIIYRKAQIPLTLYSMENIYEPEAYAFEGDARELSFIEDDTIDMVVTSPPYLNRLDYTRIYGPELALYFVSDEKMLKLLRYRTLRSHVEARYHLTNYVRSETLDQVLAELKKRPLNNEKIPDMIKGYFEDLHICLSEMYRVIKNKGIVAMVVGCSRWSGITVDVDLLVAEIGESIGFKPLEIRVAMLRGVSAQQAKRYGETQLRESIVLLKKP